MRFFGRMACCPKDARLVKNIVSARVSLITVDYLIDFTNSNVRNELATVVGDHRPTLLTLRCNFVTSVTRLTHFNDAGPAWDPVDSATLHSSQSSRIFIREFRIILRIFLSHRIFPPISSTYCNHRSRHRRNTACATI